MCAPVDQAMRSDTNRLQFGPKRLAERLGMSRKKLKSCREKKINHDSAQSDRVGNNLVLGLVKISVVLQSGR